MVSITDRNKVPICRCCNVGHWSDTVDSDGFCAKHARSKCAPEREEGYYWVRTKDRPEPFIDYYGPNYGIDQLDSSKKVVHNYYWADYFYEDYCYKVLSKVPKYNPT